MGLVVGLEVGVRVGLRVGVGVGVVVGERFKPIIDIIDTIKISAVNASFSPFRDTSQIPVLSYVVS